MTNFDDGVPVDVTETARTAVRSALDATADPLEHLRLLDAAFDVLDEDAQDEAYGSWGPAVVAAYEAEGVPFPLPVDDEGQIETYGMFSLAGAYAVHEIIEDMFAEYEAAWRRLDEEDVDWVYVTMREQVRAEGVFDTEVRETVKAIAAKRARALNAARA